MIAQTIKLLLSNLTPVLFIVALVAASLSKKPGPRAERYLSWLLLLSVGVASLWAGLFHVFLPKVASASIGWAPSPFEFEIGVADIALGVVAIASFWRSLAFKSAIALYAIVFYLGVTVGHVRQALASHDYAANNFGLLLVVTVLHVILLSALLLAAWRGKRAP